MALSDFHSLPLSIAQLSLAAVLKCGQSFRWSVLPSLNEYRLCLRDRVVCLRQSDTTLFYRAVFPFPPPDPAIRDAETLLWLNDYFQLHVDLTSLYQEWSARDPVFAALQSRFQGIRMLRQDPWENLVSFICSSNNNISRITNMVQALCTHYSPPLLSLPDSSSGSQLRTYHPFPAPSVLATPDVTATLRSLGFGYRADFIQRTARMLVETHGSSTLPTDPTEASEKWLMTLRSKSAAEAREELLKFVGVGRKVADCVLLMSLDKKEVIPVDTHVHQIAVKHYGLKGASNGKKATMSPKIYEDVNTKLLNVWGDYAGWAHSVLFTADLKSFSTYGLETPPESSTLTKQTKAARDKILALPTPPMTPSPSPLKRKREDQVTEFATVTAAAQKDSSDAVSLAERVKTRRRAR